MTLVEHLKAQRLVGKLEGHKNKGRQAVMDHLIPYPAVIYCDSESVRIRLLDFEDLVAHGPCKDSAIRLAQDALLRRILTMMRDSTPVPPPDQYLEFVEDQQIVMVHPLELVCA